MPGFNPRPSSLTGERDPGGQDVADALFQSTPVITDGRTDDTSIRVVGKVVSIHARHH